MVDDLEKLCVLEVERGKNGLPHEMRVRKPEDWDRPVNSTTQVPVNSTSHTKEIYKDNIKESIKERPSASSFEEEGDDDDGMTYEEYIARKKAGEWADEDL